MPGYGKGKGGMKKGGMKGGKGRPSPVPPRPKGR